MASSRVGTAQDCSGLCIDTVTGWLTCESQPVCEPQERERLKRVRDMPNRAFLASIGEDILPARAVRSRRPM